MKNDGVSVPSYRVMVRDTGEHQDVKLILDKQGLVNFANRTYQLVKDSIDDENERETIEVLIAKTSNAIEIFNEVGEQEIPINDLVRYSQGVSSNDGCVNLIGLVKWVRV
jgi:hypothetical protein